MSGNSVNKNRVIAFVMTAFVCFVGIAVYNYMEKTKRSVEQNMIDNIEESTDKEKRTETEGEYNKSDTVIVQITGAVNKPDVYTISADARLKDLIEKAGGFTEDAYTDNLNLAEHISDAQKYVVLSCNKDVDKIAALEQNISSADDETDLININTADADELKKLKGIGDGLAARIIEYREKYGDFTSIDELKEVSGVGESLFNELEDKITID
jgi:competence protein ComEA